MDDQKEMINLSLKVEKHHIFKENEEVSVHNQKLSAVVFIFCQTPEVFFGCFRLSITATTSSTST